MRLKSFTDDLSISWNVLSGKYTADAGLIRTLFAEIELAYNSDRRFYHNLSHIQYLLSLSEEYAKHLKDKDTVDFAIFYHDIIYDVSRSDNEERSAAVASERLNELSVPKEKISAIADQIIASKAHVVYNSENDTDLAWFLDFDMSILGAEWERYLEYSRDVRREYDMYPDVVYNAGRKHFLRQTFSMPFIFHTHEFRETFERRARENLKKELDLLDSLS